MITLSTDSVFYIAILLMAPLILRNNSPIRRYLFLAINLTVFFISMKEIAQAAVAVLWLILPYLITKLADKKSLKNWRPATIIVMVACFAYLMHYDAVFNALHIPYVFPWRILGLSYFLFRQIDFIMQYEYLKETQVKLTFLDYINHLLNFYTLLAGPILRYEEFVTDFYSPVKPLTKQDIFGGLNRALNGYLKIYVVSAIMSYHASYWFNGLKNHSNIITTAGAFFLFAFFNCWYIYFNFSGYCDIVNSFASLAGFTLHENFNRPYLAASVAEFWNRHHITLSEWIRDYLYSPMFKALLTGPCAKNAALGQYIALFLTFTIAGIWHGTDGNYLTYGLFQGLGIVVATSFKSWRKKHWPKEKNKAWEKDIRVLTAGRIITWSYISLTFSFVGYDVLGLLK